MFRRYVMMSVLTHVGSWHPLIDEIQSVVTEIFTFAREARINLA